MNFKETILAVVSGVLLGASSEDLSEHITNIPSYIEVPIFLISFSIITYLFVKKGYSKSV